MMTADNVKAIAYGAALLGAAAAIWKLWRFGKVAVDAVTAVPRAALNYLFDPAERVRVQKLYGVTGDEPPDDSDSVDYWQPYQ